ncbi:MAG: hypothetical protein AB2L22_17040 [Syntrophales bacterium]|jgi:hypothetical protein
MGAESFPFVKIPEHLKDKIGIPDPGTRLYRAYGPEEGFSDWSDVVFEICYGEGCVSPGGAAGYARVSRPGVHKKLKSGGLTAFVYHVTRDSILFKGKKKLSANANFYCFIPVSECRAWAQELGKKRDKTELAKEIMGNGDFNDKYLDNPPKHLKKKLREEQKTKS